MRYGVDVPWDYWKIKIAERMGWSLEYVDAVDMRWLEKIIWTWDAEVKAQRPSNPKQRGRARR